MDAMDEQAVITVDIPGAFLQGDWPQEEHPAYIKFEGLMVDMICDINPSCIDKVHAVEQATHQKILICSVGQSCVRYCSCSNYILQ